MPPLPGLPGGEVELPLLQLASRGEDWPWGGGTPSTKTNLVAVRVMGSLVVKALPSFLGCAVLVFYYCLPQIMKSGEGLPPSSPFAVPRDFLVLGSQVRKVVLSSSTAGLCLAR